MHTYLIAILGVLTATYLHSACGVRVGNPSGKSKAQVPDNSGEGQKRADVPESNEPQTAPGENQPSPSNTDPAASHQPSPGTLGKPPKGSPSPTPSPTPSPQTEGLENLPSDMEPSYEI